MRKFALLHPFVFATASIVYMFLISSVVASPDQTIRLLFIFWGILIFLIPPAYWVTKNWEWAGILLSVFAASFFSPPIFFQAEMVSVGAVLICYFAFLYIKRRPLKPYHMANILNIISVILFVVVFSGLVKQFSTVSLFDIPQYTWEKRSQRVVLSDQDAKPDIYYIVLDGYGRADVLDEYYSYDNSGFIEKLKEKGFVVPSESRSNYPKTILSIPSTLNMNYVSDLLPKLQDKDTYYWWLMSPLIDHSNVREALENIGYRSYSIDTGWGLTDNPTTDVYYQPYPLTVNDFESMVFSITPMNYVSPLLSKVAYYPSFKDHRELVLYNFSTLSEIAEDDSPKFVFAHIVSPHPPFVFDENGMPLTPDYRYSFNDASDVKLTDEEYREGYINQLQFINKQIDVLVDEILRKSKTPPIIILQADHGPGMLTDFGSSANTCLKERFSIFAAYYLPGTKPGVIPDDITPVNLFRIIFNQYFDSDFEILPRHHYYLQDAINIFHDEEVTPIVDTCSIH